MKKWQIVLIVILVCIPVIVGIFLGGSILKDVFNELGEEKKLKAEMEEITELLEKQDISEDEINKKLDVIVTDGDYGKVEKASKEYLKDFCNIIFTVTNAYNNEEITNALSAENYKNDGPNFVKTKKNLDDLISVLRQSLDEYEEIISDKKIMEYIDKYKLDDYYVDLYKDEIIGDMSEVRKNNDMSDAINLSIEYAESIKNILSFLQKNKGKWEVEGSQILFANQALVDEYNKMLDDLQSKVNDRTDSEL